jgi:hypothetical protein
MVLSIYPTGRGSGSEKKAMAPSIRRSSRILSPCPSLFLCDTWRREPLLVYDDMAYASWRMRMKEVAGMSCFWEGPIMVGPMLVLPILRLRSRQLLDICVGARLPNGVKRGNGVTISAKS